MSPDTKPIDPQDAPKVMPRIVCVSCLREVEVVWHFEADDGTMTLRLRCHERDELFFIAGHEVLNYRNAVDRVVRHPQIAQRTKLPEPFLLSKLFRANVDDIDQRQRHAERTLEYVAGVQQWFKDTGR